MTTIRRHLGKHAKVTDPQHRTLQLKDYLTTGAPPPPVKKSWIYNLPTSQIPMYGNDTLVDCVIATMAHMLDMWSFVTTGKIIGFSTQQINSMYTAIGGYNPNAPLVNGVNPTDNGCDMLTASRGRKGQGAGRVARSKPG